MYHASYHMMMGTCLEAYLDLHVEARPPHVVEHWWTLSRWSLNKCYAMMREQAARQLSPGRGTEHFREGNESETVTAAH
jgi:hypothetical protein